MIAPLYMFREQFLFEPIIENNNQKENKLFVVCGMGGSALSAKLLQSMYQDIDMIVHSDYGLPKVDQKKQVLYIISSFSGNTEEAISCYDEASLAGYRVAVVTSGGTLLEKAKTDGVPHIVIPQTGLEPRFTIGYQAISLLSLMHLPVYRDELKNISNQIDVAWCDREGRNIATYCGRKWPMLYSGDRFSPVAYAIKVAVNEGAKRPAFSNVLPEANHNELEMFSSLSKEQRDSFMVLLILDSASNVRVQKREKILNDMFVQMEVSPYIFYTDSSNRIEFLKTLLVGYFFATYLALDLNLDPYKTETIQKFKHALS